MPDLAELVEPGRTAVVTSEVQGGVLGGPSALPVLADAAAAVGLVPNIARLVQAARAAGAQVIHCTAYRRSDAKGANRNARLFRAVQKQPEGLLPGTPLSEVLPELGPEPEDLVLTRTHGLDPMTGTDLDPVLRNLGVTTVIVTGVSLNVAITNLVFDAVNHAYDVVVPRDAVVGIPREYGEMVLEHTLAYLATVTTTDDVIAAWQGAG